MQTATRFECSADADAHLDKLELLAQHPMLTEWCDATDDHFNAGTAEILGRLRETLAELREALETAC